MTVDVQRPDARVRILAAVDGRDQQPDALALADALAAVLDGAVLVVHVWPLSQSAPRYGGPGAEVVRGEAEELVAAAAAGLKAADGTRSPGSDFAAQTIVELADDDRADLIVLGASHRSRVGRIAFGSVADRVVHEARCAVAVAPRGHATGDATVRSVAVGYDSSPQAEAALAWAVRVALHAGAALVLYAILEPPPLLVYPAAAAQSYATLVDHQRQQLRRALDAALGRLPGALDARGEVLEGSAAATLESASGEHDLLVVGSRGHGALGRVLLGGVSHALLHHAACPVVVLPRHAVPE